MKTSRILLTSTASALAILGVTAASAQAVPPVGPAQATDQVAGPMSEQADDTATEDVIVTGSRIRRPNDDSPIPITTVTTQEIFETGRISVGDTLNQLPQLRSSLGSQNSTSGLGVRRG